MPNPAKERRSQKEWGCGSHRQYADGDEHYGCAYPFKELNGSSGR